MPQVTKKSKSWPGAFEAFGNALNHMKANPVPVVVFLAASLLVSILQMINYGEVPTDVKGSLFYSSYNGIVYLVFLLAIPTYALAVADRKGISLGEFMRFNAKKYFFVLMASLIYTVIVSVSLLLLIVPVIWTLPWFALATLLAADRGLNPIAALKESRRLAQNHKAKIWAIVGVAILVSLVLGLFAAIPVIGQLLSAIISPLLGLLVIASLAQFMRWSQTQAEQ